jgi:F-type H+-transporting ATPase subunit delta
MIAREVAHKYAGALFLAAREKDVVSQIYDELGDLDKVAQKEKNLLDYLVSPRVLESDKLSFVGSILTDRVHPMISQFMVVLIEKGRVKFLHEIVDEFNRKVEAERGIGRATVITAIKLTDGEKKKLVEKLSAKINLKVVLEEEIDNSIMGGVIIITHDQIIDGSVRHGLDVIEQTLSKIRVA